MSRRGGGLAIALAILLVLSGCNALSGDPATTVGPGETPSETTATPEPSTPTPEPSTPTPEPSTPTATPERETTEPPTTPDGDPRLSVTKRATAWDSDRTISGNVSLLSARMPQFDGRNRTVWVYVPPSYDDGDAAYPVVYMQDGQNLFDEQAAFKGEWGVDETMERLAAEEDLEAIVVGVEHAGMTSGRGDEYLPWESKFNDVGGNGSRYAAFLAETLKPAIDNRYRTEPDNATVMGSSYGGVVSIYTAFAYPETFQYVGGMSNAHMGVPEMYGFLNESGPGPQRVYIDWGTDELNFADQFVRVNKRLTNVTAALGYDRGETLLAVEENGGKHNEAYWSERFPRAIEWLLTGDD